MFRLILTYLFLTFMIGNINAQDTIGGPYQPDSATVLLMHFDGNLQNETDKTADGEIVGKTSFVNQNKSDEFGQQLRLHNGESNKLYYVKVPDTSALDLTGNWTIEMWINIDSLLYTENDFRRNAIRFLVKPTDKKRFDPNYYLKLDNVLSFRTGYYNFEDQSLIEITYKDRLHVKEWYHLTFIRDTSRKTIRQLVHQNANNPESLPFQDDSLRVIYSDVYNYGENSSNGLPQTADHPLFFGAIPYDGYSDLDGFIDEVRISNVARYENTVSSIRSEKHSLPSSTSLKQNYPNPFNPTTNIRFSLPKSEHVTLDIYNSIGQKVDVLIKRQMKAGFHSVTFNARDLTSGVYIYRLKAGEYRKSKKMLLLK